MKRNEAVFQYFCDTARSGSTLFVAGDFDDDTQQYWTDKSAGKIIFLGFLQVNEIRQVIEYCDAYISYSRSEGMSEALLQAAALSKILVLSTIPSFQEFSKKSCNESGNIFLNTVYDLDKLKLKKCYPNI